MVQANVSLEAMVRAASGMAKAVSIFHCCEPCRTGQCGHDCRHVELDGSRVDEGANWRHDGCHCFVVLEAWQGG
jgi:hypothetical protein